MNGKIILGLVLLVALAQATEAPSEENGLIASFEVSGGLTMAEIENDETLDVATFLIECTAWLSTVTCTNVVATSTNAGNSCYDVLTVTIESDQVTTVDSAVSSVESAGFTLASFGSYSHFDATCLIEFTPQTACSSFNCNDGADCYLTDFSQTADDLQWCLNYCYSRAHEYNAPGCCVVEHYVHCYFSPNDIVAHTAITDYSAVSIDPEDAPNIITTTTTSTTTTTTTAASYWSVDNGYYNNGCYINNNCIGSSEYDDFENCGFVSTHSGNVAFSNGLSIETCCDNLHIGGTDINADFSSPLYVSTGTTVSWSSDSGVNYDGWELCFTDYDCVDTSNGATDTWGDDCSYYETWASNCGDYDDSDFQANTMCCACENAITWDISISSTDAGIAVGLILFIIVAPCCVCCCIVGLVMMFCVGGAKAVGMAQQNNKNDVEMGGASSP